VSGVSLFGEQNDNKGCLSELLVRQLAVVNYSGCLKWLRTQALQHAYVDHMAMRCGYSSFTFAAWRTWRLLQDSCDGALAAELPVMLVKLAGYDMSPNLTCDNMSLVVTCYPCHNNLSLWH
jgi:hypothetical protein